MKKNKFVIITRAMEDGENIKEKFSDAGFLPYHSPSIRIAKKKISKEEAETLAHLDAFDHCIFTSPHAVTFFLETLQELGIDRDLLGGVKILVVGDITAQKVREAGLPIYFAPEHFTSLDVLSGLGDIKDKKILLPRSAIAFRDLENKLKGKGAKVSSVDLYITIPIEKPDAGFIELLERGAVKCITFASSSAVNGFVAAYKSEAFFHKVLELSVVCIGPRTGETAKEAGFKNLSISETSTTDGMIEAIKHLS